MIAKSDFDIPETMRAIYIDEFKKHPVVKIVPVPLPKKGEILIKVYAVPIQPADLAFIAGQYKTNRKPPTIIGVEGSGLVIKNGGGILGWNLVGRQVGFPCKENLMGTWSEYVVTQANSCIPLDPNSKYEAFASMIINPKEKYKAIIQTAACSAIGKMINRFFTTNGIPVINVVRRKEQEEIMKNDERALYVLNSSDPDFPKQVQELASKLQATCLFDVVAGDITNTILKNMPYKSTVYIYGALSTKNIQIEPNELIFRKKDIRGFWMSEHLHTQVGMLWRMEKGYLLKNWMNNVLSYSVSMEFPFEKVNEAIEYYKLNMSRGKVLLKPQIDTPRLPTYLTEKPRL